MKNLLCLDLGSTTGWAYVALGDANGTAKILFSGSWDFRPRRFDGAGMRYVKFRNNLLEMLDKTPIDAVYFEEVRRHAGADAARVYGALFGVVTSVCEEKHIAYEGIPVGTIKKFWTGRGNAKKDDMIAGAQARGYHPKDDNEADAIALAYYAVSLMAQQEKQT